MRRFLRASCLAGPSLLVLALVTTTGLHAHPASVFVAGSPAGGAAIPRKTEVATGSYSVSPSTGAASFAFPITVPPARNGVTPSLSLGYSSQNPLRGGVAAGWTLPIPSIEIDTREGRLAGVVFRSTLSGGQRLVRVPEPVESAGLDYRAERDAEFIRYEHRGDMNTVNTHWRAMHPGGMTYYFGETIESRDSRLGPDGANAITSRWMLTRIVDAFGNAVVYQYQKVTGDAINGTVNAQPVDIALTRIEYGRNAAADLWHHARIELEYDDSKNRPCPGSNVPIGAQFTYRSGLRTYLGARLLSRVRVESRSNPAAAFTTRRQIDLTYDATALSCTQKRAPLRILTSIRETVTSQSGVALVLPPITFDYGSTARPLTATGPGLPVPTGFPDVGRGEPRVDFGQAGGWPSTKTMMTDLNGDARPDYLRSTDENCSVSYYEQVPGSPPTAINSRWPSLPFMNATAADHQADDVELDADHVGRFQPDELSE